MEALNAGQPFDKLFIMSATKSEALIEIRKLALEMGIEVQSVPEQKLKRLTNANHQGVAGFLSLIQYYKTEDLLSQAYEHGQMPFFIVLDGVMDVRNLGAIVRSAQCFNAHGIIIPSAGSAPVNGDAIKASAGALTSFPICRTASLKDEVQYLKDNGLTIVSTAVTKADYVYKVDLNVPLCLIMGSEDKGVDHQLLNLSDIEINIPQIGMFDSLNVSVAAGVLFYEITRQRL